MDTYLSVPEDKRSENLVFFDELPTLATSMDPIKTVSKIKIRGMFVNDDILVTV